MSEFMPETTASNPNQGTGGAEAYQGMPDLQGQPFDPRRSYAQQAPAYPAQQAVPPVQPAPPVQPYGQPAPPGQPYGQPAPFAPDPQNPAWGAPPPAWNSAPAKKRKVWPWVVGGIGAVVVLGTAAVIAALFVGKAAVDGLNPNYDAPPVTEQDVATSGGTLVVADGANASFEIDPAWIDQTALVDGVAEVSDEVALSYIGAWSTADFADGQDVSLVTVIVGQEKLPIVGATLTVEHDSAVKGFVDGLGLPAADVQVNDATAVTTASGLEGLHSSFTADFQGVALAGDLYTFARGNNAFVLQVTSYNGISDDAAIKQILDSVRVDS